VTRKRKIRSTLALALLLGLTAEATAAPVFFHGAIGCPWLNYPSSIQSSVDANKQNSTSSNYRLDTTLGVFIPVSWEKTLGGLIINWTYDKFSLEQQSSQTSQFTFGPSLMRFYGPTPGAGLFWKTDIGLALAHASTSSAVTSLTSKPGIGLLAGVGYSFAARNARLLIKTEYAARLIEMKLYRTIVLGLGLLL